MMWCSVNASWSHEDGKPKTNYVVTIHGVDEEFMEKIYKFIRTEAETELKKEQISNARKMLELLENYSKDYAEEKERILVSIENFKKESEAMEL